MTKDEAVKIWLVHGSRRIEKTFRRRAPEHIADRGIMENADDCIDGLIALGLLRVEPDEPAVVLHKHGGGK